MNTKTKWITRTGLLVALVIVAQAMGKIIPAGAVIFGPFNLSQLITGTLVNLLLITATAIVGIGSGVTVGILSSILATLLGIGPIFPIITPVIACGNVILVLIVGLFFRLERSTTVNKFVLRIAGIVLGAAVKCGFLWIGVPFMFRFIPEIKPQQIKMLSIMFSWPQGVTALCGGLLSLLVIGGLRKALDNRA